MFPVDLVFVQELAGQALECLARALPDAPAAQRELLLTAMNALDDIEALVGCGFELAADLVRSDCDDAVPATRAVASVGIALVA